MDEKYIQDEEIEDIGQKKEFEEDVLDEIFVDKNIPMDKKLLLEILKSFVTIDNEGVINYTEAYDKLNDGIKVLVYLAAKKAKVAKGIIEKDQEAAGPKEISESAGVGLSTAKVAVSQSFKKFLNRVSGGYLIPNYNLKKVKEIVLENGN